MGGSDNLENDGPIACWGLDNIADDENGTTEEMLEMLYTLIILSRIGKNCKSYSIK